MLQLACVLCLTGVGSIMAAAQGIDLLADPDRWHGNIDQGGTTLEQGPTDEAALSLSVTPDGGDEDYPKLSLVFPQAQDWSQYLRLRMRVRVTSEDPGIRSRRLTVVFYDELTRREDLEDRPMTQQCIGLDVPVGRWMELSNWLLNIHRTRIAKLDLYLYEQPSQPGQSYRWEFAQLELEGVGDQATLLDMEVYATGAITGARTAPVGRVSTLDGLELTLGTGGDVTTVSVDGEVVGASSASVPCGLLVRDAATQEPPRMVGGAVRQTEGVVVQEADSAPFGLAVRARYASAGDWLEVTGTVRDLRGQDRAVTVYLALPLADVPWQWWDSVAASRLTAGPAEELAYLETGMGYGLHGAHSRYPLGAVSAPPAGLTLAVRMDEPVVHRIVYNPALKLFFVALDFGLVAEQAVDGRSLSEAPFRILLYRHDPTWGFRSALQRYYDFFPHFFTKRVRTEGGWYVWGNTRDTERAAEVGFGFHWGPNGNEAVKWDNEHGMLALLYIEPEFFQQTMGDFDRAPTVEEAIERLQKVAAGDEAETAKFEKLGYAHSYTPGSWVAQHSLRESLRAVSRAAVASVYHDVTGSPYAMIGQFPWMSESQWGVIFPCNLDPDIPQGKGWFNRTIYLEYGLREPEAIGAHYDGIGLDSFGGYGQWSRVDYRRENFRYANIPLSFSATDRAPIVVAPFSSVEWVRELAADMHARGKVLMANCAWGFAPGWLTFAAPYLDIFGAESHSFGDPEYVRAIAYRKSLTDLPYTPRPDEEVAWHLLLDIFPGHGNKVEVMEQYAPTLRALAAAGWEPITHARAEPTKVRMERYGTGAGAYLVLHNPQPEATPVRVTVDTAALGLPQLKVTAWPADVTFAVADNTAVVELAAKGTVVLRLGGE